MDKVYAQWAREFSKTMDEEKQQFCSVCLEEFERGEQIIQLRCNSMHIFHLECIQSWAQRNRTCPLCRSDIRKQAREEENAQQAVKK